MPKNYQSSVRIHEELAGRIKLRGGFQVAFEKIAGRYMGLLERNQPELTENEASLLVDVCNGWMSDGIPINSIGFSLAAEVEDGCRLDGLDAKWSVDAVEFVARIRKWSAVESLSVLDSIECFWQAVTDREENVNVNEFFNAKEAGDETENVL